MKVVGDASKARFIACFIDNIIGFFVMLIIVRTIPEELSTPRALAVVFGYLGYFIIFEGLWGRTIGKYLQGLVVRNLDGSSAGWTAAIIRSLARIVEVNPALLGGLPAGLTVISSERKQRLGDMLAGTVVVSDKLKWDADTPQS